jgi:pimeloyl-ACP methyl ester carboxylesterase
VTDLHLDVPGARLGYDVSGAGPVVVQAHGLSSSRAGDLTDLSPVTAAGFRLVRYDARGHGASTGRPDPASYVWSALADDLLALLDVVSPGAPVDGFGSSMGTATLIFAALRAPHRFRRLVLAVPPTAWATREPQRAGYREAAELIATHGLAWFAALTAEQPLPPAAPDSLDPTPQVTEALFPAVLRGAADSDLPDPAALAALTHPTLLLPWAGDPGHPVSTAEILRDALPDATLELARTPTDVAGWGRRAADFLR